MSVLIQGMKVPDNCFECEIWNYCKHKWYLNPFDRPDNCPIVGIPDKHGNLIDLEELIYDLHERFNENDDEDFANKEIWYALDDAPIIIEESD